MGTRTYEECVGSGDRRRDNYSDRINLHNGRIPGRDGKGGRRMKGKKPLGIEDLWEIEDEWTGDTE
jgi:hypothetical protein